MPAGSSLMFSALKQKLLQNPGRDADQRFWSRFDQEFSAASPPRSLILPRFAMTFGFLLLAVSIWTFVAINNQVPSDEEASAGAILQHQELAENLELFSSNDLLELDDSEWEILLEDSDET